MRATGTAAALLVAAVCVAGASAPAAAPAPAGSQVAAQLDPARLDPADRLLPQPRELTLTGGELVVPAVMALAVVEGTDERVVREARELLTNLGVEEIEEVAQDETPDAELALVVTDDVSAVPAPVLEGFGITPAPEDAAEGYATAVGHFEGVDAAVVVGNDARGALYGLRTLAQLATIDDDGASLATGTVRDWPELPLRGVIEGFYGKPWSHADRLEVIDFVSQVKGNSYVYAPKDDPYHLAQWREPYPAEELARITELVDAADATLVDFVFTVSPGNDICYSDADDVAALLDKLDAMAGIGVQQFGIFFDDIDLELDCAADVEAYGHSASPAAAAQAHLLETVLTEFVEQQPEPLELLTVPTQYSGTEQTEYTDVFAAEAPEDVVVYWTGPAVVADTITAEDADAATALWQHQLAVWDNYPVNDFAPARLFMGPLIGRDADLAEHGVVGFSANPMNQARASQVPLATVHDYLWNPSSYEPGASWDAALELVGGPAADALRVFAQNSYGSDIGHPANPVLTGLIEDFETAWESGSGVDGAAEPLVAYLEAMAGVPEAGLDEALVAEVEPWVEKVGAYGEAGAAGVRSLLADLADDETAAWEQRRLLEEAAARAGDQDVEVSGGIMDAFLTWLRGASRLVTVTAPEAGAEYDVGDDITIAAEVRSGDVEIAEVRFYAGTELVGTDTTAPYGVTWHDVPEGMPSLYAVAHDDVGTAVESGTVRVTVGDPEPVLLVVGPPEGMATADVAGDVATRARIEFLGYPVETVLAPEVTTQDADGVAAVVVSESVSSGDVATKFRDVPVPVGVYEHFVYDDMGMAADPNLQFRTFDVDVVAPKHPVAAGTDGVVRIYSREGVTGFGTPGAGATVVATVPEQPELAVLFAYDEGDAMVDLDAPARRLGLPYVDDATAVLTEEGQAIFDAAMLWLVEGEAEEPTPTPSPTDPGSTPSPTDSGPEPTTPAPPSPTAPGGGGGLPSTGASGVALAGLAGLVLLAAGAALVRRRHLLG
ncbi:beta-N-acetylglucosaminidase domain-containing protein [Georgenia satyanarayanai]|uniref:beta-N-acetylglucosaminidase domain-containing protein n=1 Tax=Georgenia satyanarayanai TaxID=860221 RepID=UPI00203B7791|nr:beta-N-acetylglucosaminidase domain-containing protein [Georgenia satyanarayanai]MCM3659764.1 beta-N-acetylglucosaminidase domain-containing protein [Georgenia satyanarayanai]